MKQNDCQNILDQWLERLPRADLSPSIEEHISDCKHCSTNFKSLQSVANILSQDDSAQILDPSEISHLNELVQTENKKLHGRRMIWKLSAVGIACLPVVVFVNGAWALAGYRLIESFSGPEAARFFLGLSLTTATAVTGLFYSSIPIIASWFSRKPSVQGACQ